MRVVVIEPAQPAVSYEEAAQHLRLDGDDERAYVEMLIAVAQGHIDGPDGWLGRAIGVQVLDLHMDSWPSSLPYRLVSEVLSVTVDGQAIGLDGIKVDPDGLLNLPPRLPRPASGVVIRYRAGGDSAPAPIKAAILLMVGDLYANRETTSDRARPQIQSSVTVDRLLAPYRVWSI